MRNNLPKSIKKAIESPENFQKICKIIKSFNLGIEEINNIFDFVYLKIMQGEMPPSGAIKEIELKAKISQEMAEKIWNEINDKMLVEYKEDLKKIYPEEKILSPKTISEKKPIPSKSSPETEKTENVDDLLERLSKEIKTEKIKRQKIDKELNNHVPQKITPVEKNSQANKKKSLYDSYKEKIDTED